MLRLTELKAFDLDYLKAIPEVGQNQRFTSLDTDRPQVKDILNCIFTYHLSPQVVLAHLGVDLAYYSLS